MKFAVELLSKNSGRLGCLTKANVELKTPLVLNYTKAASIPHISREVFDLMTSEKQLIEICIETTHLMEEAAKVFPTGIATFAGLDHTLSLVTLKDTAISNPSFFNRDSISILPRTGRVTITPTKYMDIIESFKPDFFHTLCDGDTMESCGNKRIYNAVNRTDNFFQICVERYRNSSTLAGSMLIAPVEGGYSSVYRENVIKSLNAIEYQDIIGGYFIDGFHSNGETAYSINNDKVAEIVKGCNGLLPQNKLKIMLGAYSPTLIVSLVQLGVDVFDTTYAYLAMTRNCALTFNFDVNKKSLAECEFEIDLSDEIHRDRFEPFSKDCVCLACKNHTRAYTHHLLNTNEMVGPILLMIHNTHHYLEFFKIIRQAVANDTLSALIDIISLQQKKYDSKQTERQRQKDSANKTAEETNSVVKKVRVERIDDTASKVSSF